MNARYVRRVVESRDAPEARVVEQVAVMRPAFKVQAEIEDAGIPRAEPPGAARAEQARDHECQNAPVGEYEHLVVVAVAAEQALDDAAAAASTLGQRFGALYNVPVPRLFVLLRDFRELTGYLGPGKPRKYADVMLFEVVPVGDRGGPGG